MNLSHWIRNKLLCSACIAAIATGVVAQDDAPLSAIDWLSESVEPASTVIVTEPAITRDATSPTITVTPLDHPTKATAGLLSSRVTGLPRDLWANSSEELLADLMRAEPAETLPAMQDLLTTLLLARADAPIGLGNKIFIARIDKLLDLGALEQAKALIEDGKPDNPDVFRRWFDVALLTATEDQVCGKMRETIAIAPTYTARIFCLARGGDWNAAVLTLNTHRILGDITPAEEALLSRFLDPELFEGEPPLPIPSPMTPLLFRMHEAVGEAITTTAYPLAFAHADLRTTTGWKARLEAAERLARNGAISENVLLQLYTDRVPAASGGIWDRADAIQDFDRAMTAGDADKITKTLPAAWDAMKEARTEIAFAKLYGAALQDSDVSNDLTFEIGLLSTAYEDTALNQPNGDAFLNALARGNPQEVQVSSPKALAIQAAFNGAPVPAPLIQLIKDDKLGEALLRTIAIFDAGYAGDTGAITDALATLRSVGLEDIARRAALQLILLDRDI